MNRKEAKCNACGATYTLRSEKVPKAMKCFCENKSFQVVDLK